VVDPGSRPSLGEETRALTRTRIVRGAAAALASRGFDATVDDIAAAAGVSRRTVFRHFATHEEVVTEAVAEIMADYERRMPGPPAPGQSLEAWLNETAVTVHRLNVGLMGKAFWDMNADRPGISAEENERMRLGFAAQLARYAWRGSHGKGQPPPWVVDAFALQLSGFTTNCFRSYHAEKTGRLSARILRAVLVTALAEEKASAGRPVR
jgi:AcrR family transcriptional regulator